MKSSQSPEAQNAMFKLENKQYEPWEIQRLLKTICETGEFNFIRRAILILEKDGYNPLNR